MIIPIVIVVVFVLVIAGFFIYRSMNNDEEEETSSPSPSPSPSPSGTSTNTITTVIEDSSTVSGFTIEEVEGETTGIISSDQSILPEDVYLKQIFVSQNGSVFPVYLDGEAKTASVTIDKNNDMIGIDIYLEENKCDLVTANDTNCSNSPEETDPSAKMTKDGKTFYGIRQNQDILIKDMEIVESDGENYYVFDLKFDDAGNNVYRILLKETIAESVTTDPTTTTDPATTTDPTTTTDPAPATTTSGYKFLIK